ncbi:MAG: right-handed parallel beta-helix repeat-containing protein [Lachnospiraceae bacterium]|nr:right-handed parallel beta-helix repeat-containing protein [Lachnospiraceae bacterium]
MKKKNLILAMVSFVAAITFAVALRTGAFADDQAAFVSASVSVSSDFTLHVKATAPASVTSPQVTFVRAGEEDVTVDGTKLKDGWLFSYTGIHSECMADVITMNLKNGSSVLTTGTYSIKQYFTDLRSAGASGLGMSSTQFNALKKLMADILEFGAATQNYISYNTSSLANSPSWVASEKTQGFTAPASDREVVLLGEVNNRIYSAKIIITNIVNLSFSVNAREADRLVVADESGKTATYFLSDFDGKEITCAGLPATSYDTVWTVTLTDESGEVYSRVKYSVNSYIATMAASAEGTFAAILRAMYNYGVSAETYVETAYNQSKGLFDRSISDGKLALYFFETDSQWNSADDSVHGGDCALFILPDGTTCMVDCNLPNNGSYISDALKKLGVSRIDYFISSHPHIDHLGGFSVIAREVEIGHVIMPDVPFKEEYMNAPYWRKMLDIIEERNIPVTRAAEGDTLQIGEMSGWVINPDSNFDPNTMNYNEGSLVIRFTWRGASFMLGGDIGNNEDLGQKTEDIIVAKYGSSLRSDIAKLNHHGEPSTKSQSAGWLSNVDAKLYVGTRHAVATTEYNRLKTAFTSSGAAFMHTAIDGSVLITTDGRGTYNAYSGKVRTGTYAGTLTSNSTVTTSTTYANSNTSGSKWEKTEAYYTKEIVEQQLAAAGADTIVLNEDIFVTEPLTVNGNKTLSGTGSITMLPEAEQFQSVLDLKNGARLTLNGPTIDANGAASGAAIASGAKLTINSGAITYGCPYGAEVTGQLEVNGGAISDSQGIGVYVHPSATATISGGEIDESTFYGIWNEASGSVSISGDAEISNTGYCLIYNCGSCTVTGGTVHDAGTYLAYNLGNLTINGTGTATGKVEWYGAGSHAISQRDTGTLNVNGLYFHDTGWHGISSIAGAPQMVLKNIKAENVTQAAFYLRSGARLENIEISNSSIHGIWIEEGVTATVNTASISNVGTYDGIYVNGGTLTGSNITVNSANYNGVEVLNNGSATIDGLTITGTGRNGALVTNGTLDVSEVSIDGTGWHGIHVERLGTLRIDTAEMENVSLNGIFVAGGSVNGSDVAVDTATQGLAADGGTVNIDGYSISNTSSNGVKMYNGAVITLDDLEIDTTTTNHGVYVMNGTRLTLNTADISNINNYNGIYVEGGTLTGGNVTIDSCNYNGIEVLGGGSATINGLTSNNSNRNGALINYGTLDITNASFSGNKYHGIDVERNGILRVDTAEILGSTLNGIFVAGGTVTGSDVTVDTATQGLAADGGTVDINGYSISNTSSNGIKIYNRADVTITDLAIDTTTSNHGVYVLGAAEMTVNGGTVTGAALNPFFIENGTLLGGGITVSSCGGHGLAVSGGTVDIDGYTITSTLSSRQGVNIYNRSTVEIDNLTIGAAGVHGINLETGSTLTLNTASISNIATYNGIYVNGGTLTGSNITIDKPKYNGMEVLNGGSATINGYTATNAPRNGALVTRGTFDVTNATLSGNKYHGIDVASAGILIIDTATISGNSLNAINSAGSVTGSSLTMSSLPYYGINASAGTVSIDGIQITGATRHAFNFNGTVSAEVENATINGTGWEGIGVYDNASLTLTDSSILNWHTLPVKISGNGSYTANNVTTG